MRRIRFSKDKENLQMEALTSVDPIMDSEMAQSEIVQSETAQSEMAPPRACVIRLGSLEVVPWIPESYLVGLDSWRFFLDPWSVFFQQLERQQLATTSLGSCAPKEACVGQLCSQGSLCNFQHLDIM